jgi:DinB superfamily
VVGYAEPVHSTLLREIAMEIPMPSRPDPTEYVPYYERYIRLVPGSDVLTQLEQQTDDTLTLLQGVSESDAETRHAPYTWSIKEVIGHLIDCERIFGYRALRFARHDRTELPGFDENDYVRQAGFDARSLGSLAQEFHDVRRSHVLFFRGLDGAAWNGTGIANGQPVTVRALAYIIAGHERHHIAIVRKRLAL